jgi:hypothetical protein
MKWWLLRDLKKGQEGDRYYTASTIIAIAAKERKQSSCKPSFIHLLFTYNHPAVTNNQPAPNRHCHKSQCIIRHPQPIRPFQPIQPNSSLRTLETSSRSDPVAQTPVVALEAVTCSSPIPVRPRPSRSAAALKRPKKGLCPFPINARLLLKHFSPILPFLLFFSFSSSPPVSVLSYLSPPFLAG